MNTHGKTKGKTNWAYAEPDRLVSAAAKLCYSRTGAEDILEGLVGDRVDKFLNLLMEMGHQSPIEHAPFTFAVEGVSRVLTHQLVRHRIASYSQQSQRYVRLEEFEYIIPPHIEEDPGQGSCSKGLCRRTKGITMS